MLSKSIFSYTKILFFKRVVNWIIKNILQIGFFSQSANVAYKKRLKQYNYIQESLLEKDSKIIEDINTYGIHTTSLAELQLANTDKLLECLDRVIPELLLLLSNNNKQFYLCSSSNNSIKYTDIYLWGLTERLLNIVENYLGLPAAFHGIYLRKDLANNVVRKSRLWHLDKEDRRMLKIIIYLNDVDEHNGVFQYIPKVFSDRINRQLNYNHGYIQDHKIAQVISESEWISCVGKAGTVIFVDTARVFHRGKLPQKLDRLALFFDYTSRYPLRPYYCKPSFPIADLLALSSYLTPRQKDCVFWNRKLSQNLAKFEAK